MIQYVIIDKKSGSVVMAEGLFTPAAAIDTAKKLSKKLRKALVVNKVLPVLDTSEHVEESPF